MTSNPNSNKLSTSAIVLLISLLIGIADSIYLLIAHISAKLGGNVGGLCDISAKLNCNAAISSDHSMILGVPLPVFTVAFFTGLLTLALSAYLRKDSRSKELMVVLLSGAFGYSLVLLLVMVVQLEVLCPGCIVMDAMLLVALVASSRNAGGFVSSWKSLFSAVFWKTPGAFHFLASAGVIFLLGMFYTNSVLNQPTREYTVDDAFELVENYPDRYEIDSSRAPSHGPEDAAVVIVEFSDFQCPYCSQFRHTLDQLRDAFPNDVRVHMMHYPLSAGCNPNIESSFHENACNAARAAVCADLQDGFWPLHDAMFDNQTHLDRESIDGFAEEAGLDVGRLNGCIDDQGSLERVQSDIGVAWRAVEEAGMDGIGTPFCFVNGFLVRGNQPYSALRALVQSELTRLQVEESEEGE